MEGQNTFKREGLGRHTWIGPGDETWHDSVAENKQGIRTHWRKRRIIFRKKTHRTPDLEEFVLVLFWWISRLKKKFKMMYLNLESTDLFVSSVHRTAYTYVYTRFALCELNICPSVSNQDRGEIRREECTCQNEYEQHMYINDHHVGICEPDRLSRSTWNVAKRKILLAMIDYRRCTDARNV